MTGVVYAPALGRLFVGEPAGAWSAAVTDGVLGPLVPIAVRAPADDGLVVVGSRSHGSPETDAFVARFKVADYRSAGSSLKFCLVACGEAHLYPRFGRTMELDTAAGDAVLRAAGGRMARPTDTFHLRKTQPGPRRGFRERPLRRRRGRHPAGLTHAAPHQARPRRAAFDPDRRSDR